MGHRVVWRRRLTMATLTGAAALGGTRPAEAQEARGASRRLRPLAGGASEAKTQVHELTDGRLVLVEADRAYLIGVRVAADGEYALARSGRVVVQKGHAVDVRGTPAAAARMALLP